MAKSCSSKTTSYCVGAILLLVVVVIILALTRKEKPSASPSTPPIAPTSPTSSVESYESRATREQAFMDAKVRSDAVFPYNYWYLTAFPRYIQSWKWGKGQLECADPDSFYPYYWPHNGRGLDMLGYTHSK
jgi:hypothetical protein